MEIDTKNSNNVSHVSSFCTICFYLSWQKYTKISLDGKGSYDTTKVLRRLKRERASGGKNCQEILELVTKEIASRKRLQ